MPPRRRGRPGLMGTMARTAVSLVRPPSWLAACRSMGSRRLPSSSRRPRLSSSKRLPSSRR